MLLLCSTKALSNSEFATVLRELRNKYPRPAEEDVAKAKQHAEKGGGAEHAGGSLPGTGDNAQPAFVGKVIAGRDMLGGLGVAVHKETGLPPATNISSLKLVLTATEPATGGSGSADWHVWLENAGNKKMNVPIGTYVGKGGLGQFVSTTVRPLSPDEKNKAWTFTRLTNHKKDTPTKADGCVVHQDSQVGPTTMPKMETLEEIEKRFGSHILLYAHSITRGGGKKVQVTPASTAIAWVPNAIESLDTSPFIPDNLGQFLRTFEQHEDGDKADKAGEIKGYLRPAFIVSAKQGSPTAAAPLLQPSAAPNAITYCLFTCQKIELKPSELIALS